MNPSMGKKHPPKRPGRETPNVAVSAVTDNNVPEQSIYPRAGFFRRVAAMIYDGLVAVAVGMCAGLIILVTLTILHARGVIGQDVEHFSDFLNQSFLFMSIVQIWVGAWIVGFFLWFWAKGGQTIGMRAWRMRIFSTTDTPMTFGRLWLRLVCSLGGLGTLLVILMPKQKQSLQDLVAKTEILVLTETANDHKSWR